MNTTVEDVMTTRVIWVTKDTAFREMAAALREYRVSAFPVVDDDGKVIGVVSEADLLAKEVLADPGVAAELVHHKDVRKAEGLTAGDLMTREALTASPDDPVEQATRMMHFLRVKRLWWSTLAASSSGSSVGPTCSPSSTERTRRFARSSLTPCSCTSSLSTRASSR
jgi:CBS domain-containing protein